MSREVYYRGDIWPLPDADTAEQAARMWADASSGWSEEDPPPPAPGSELLVREWPPVGTPNRSPSEWFSVKL